MMAFIHAGISNSTVRDAMNCLVPNGGSFIRAHDAGVFRSLDQAEYIDFIEALPTMPWRRAEKA